ncbi:MAG TPA: AAA family ATPase [Pyrinomonadaceae bacterium]|jgi:AAA15 family ATPase/GTPase
MSTTAEEIEKAEKGEDNKSELLLDSLEVKGYRCFEHLTIKKLGRINLIVGKNNVGKSSFLESIWVYTQRGATNVLVDILATRDDSPSTFEQNVFGLRNQKEDLKKSVWNIRHLFFGRNDIREDSKSITILPLKNKDRKVQIFAYWYDTINKKVISSPKEVTNAEPQIQNTFRGKAISTKKLDDIFVRRLENLTEIDKCLYVKASGLGDSEISELWDKITLTDAEDRVLEALQLISERIKRVNVVGGSDIGKSRLPKVVVTGEKEPIALRSMGDGMTRLFGISLSLVNCRDGILLIDEIESGLHYSVLPDVWKLIFKTARDLNVQVFATTHSKDCIEAFAQAAVDSPEEGMLIRLERHGEKIVAKTIEEEMLADAVDYDVEVR